MTFLWDFLKEADLIGLFTFFAVIYLFKDNNHLKELLTEKINHIEKLFTEKINHVEKDIKHLEEEHKELKGNIKEIWDCLPGTKIIKN